MSSLTPQWTKLFCFIDVSQISQRQSLFSRSGKQPWSFHKTRDVLTEVGSTNTDADILLYSCRTSDRPGKTRPSGIFTGGTKSRLSPERSLTGVWDCFPRKTGKRGREQAKSHLVLMVPPYQHRCEAEGKGAGQGH